MYSCVLSYIQLFVTPWTAARQAPLSMGILQARILEWAAMPSSRGSSQPRDQSHIFNVSCIGRRVSFFLFFFFLPLWLSPNAEFQALGSLRVPHGPPLSRALGLSEPSYSWASSLALHLCHPRPHSQPHHTCTAVTQAVFRHRHTFSGWDQGQVMLSES